mgnify:FL=1
MEWTLDSSNCVITSQSYETLHKVKALAPEYPTGYILALGVGNYYDLPDADFFSVETTFITSGMVNAVHLRGKTVSAWTIDREKVATHMLELGVDDLITDKPDMVQDLLARNQQVDDSLIDFRDLLNALLHPEQPADSSDDAEETITDAWKTRRSSWTRRNTAPFSCGIIDPTVCKSKTSPHGLPKQEVRGCLFVQRNGL